jgi:hypothetical protein
MSKPLSPVAVTVTPVVVSPSVKAPLTLIVKALAGAITKVSDTDANGEVLVVSLIVKLNEPAVAPVPNLATIEREPSAAVVQLV